MNVESIPLITQFNKHMPIHIVGIGGIGMSAIAFLLAHQGFKVQGSDINCNDSTKKLQNLGINIFLGHSATNIENAAIVAVSSAIPENNPEIAAAKTKGIPILPRSTILQLALDNKKVLAVTGSHGKTTTSAITTSLLTQSRFKPSALIGGIMLFNESNVIVNSGDHIVLEADESDGTIDSIYPLYSVITNIDYEHLDFYKTIDAMKLHFLEFARKTERICFACSDDKAVYDLLKGEKNVVFYGSINSPDIYLHSYSILENGSYFSFFYKEVFYENFFIPAIGKHNILNALAAIGIAINLSISSEFIRKSLSEFQGVKRRFTKIENPLKLNIIDDYAHHPTEISAVLCAAKKIYNNRIFTVIQPHRFSRFTELFNEFLKLLELSDYTYITDIYSAGESFSDQYATVEELLLCANNSGIHNVTHVQNLTNLVELINPVLQKDDSVLFLGAGNITMWALEFPKLLKPY